MKAPSSLDPVGLKAVGESIATLTKGVVDGAGAFLSRICLPAAEEYGLLLRDRVHAWRSANLARVLAKAEALVGEKAAAEGLKAHPRLVGEILNEASWVDSNELQGMWAGLLASSCTKDGQNDDNLIFVHLVSQLSSCAALILEHACSSATKTVSSNNLIMASAYHVTTEELKAITGESDVLRLDHEMDYLRSLGLLLSGGFHAVYCDARLTPSPLALHMYARCKGHRGDLLAFYGLTPGEPLPRWDPHDQEDS